MKASGSGGSRIARILSESEPTSRRERQIRAWCQALADAEAEAEREARQARPPLNPMTYSVSYRLVEQWRTDASRSERYDALVRIIRSCNPRETHEATSTWLVRSYIQHASTLMGILTPPLDPATDTLHVAHVSWSNRSEFGATGKLQS